MTLSKPDLQKKCHHLEEQLNHEMQAKDNLELKCRYRTHTHTHAYRNTKTRTTYVHEHTLYTVYIHPNTVVTKYTSVIPSTTS